MYVANFGHLSIKLHVTTFASALEDTYNMFKFCFTILSKGSASIWLFACPFSLYRMASYHHAFTFLMYF